MAKQISAQKREELKNKIQKAFLDYKATTSNEDEKKKYELAAISNKSYTELLNFIDTKL